MANRKRLLREIAQAAEEAFRRGFQQGFLTARGRMGGPVPTEDDVYYWRFAGDTGRHAVGPPGTINAGLKCDLLDRLHVQTFHLEAIGELFRGKD